MTQETGGRVRLDRWSRGQQDQELAEGYGDTDVTVRKTAGGYGTIDIDPYTVKIRESTGSARRGGVGMDMTRKEPRYAVDVTGPEDALVDPDRTREEWGGTGGDGWQAADIYGLDAEAREAVADAVDALVSDTQLVDTVRAVLAEPPARP